MKGGRRPVRPGKRQASGAGIVYKGTSGNSIAIVARRSSCQTGAIIRGQQSAQGQPQCRHTTCTKDQLITRSERCAEVIQLTDSDSRSRYSSFGQQSAIVYTRFEQKTAMPVVNAELRASTWRARVPTQRCNHASRQCAFRMHRRRRGRRRNAAATRFSASDER